MMPHRSDNDVKNKFYAMSRKKERVKKRASAQPARRGNEAHVKVSGMRPLDTSPLVSAPRTYVNAMLQRHGGFLRSSGQSQDHVRQYLMQQTGKPSSTRKPTPHKVASRPSRGERKCPPAKRKLPSACPAIAQTPEHPVSERNTDTTPSFLAILSDPSAMETVNAMINLAITPPNKTSV